MKFKQSDFYVFCLATLAFMPVMIPYALVKLPERLLSGSVFQNNLQLSLWVQNT